MQEAGGRHEPPMPPVAMLMGRWWSTKTGPHQSATMLWMSWEAHTSFTPPGPAVLVQSWNSSLDGMHSSRVLVGNTPGDPLHSHRSSGHARDSQGCPLQAQGIPISLIEGLSPPSLQALGIPCAVALQGVAESLKKPKRPKQSTGS